MSLVYRHRRKDNDSVFYVGMGRDYKRAFSKRNRNIFWNNIVNKVGYYVEIIQDNLSQQDAFELEMFLISIYGRRDLKTGILCNLTDGGDGRTNIVISYEERVRRSNNFVKKEKQKILRGTKKECTRFQKVIDTKTNVVYDTIIDACNASGFSLRHFKRCLYGERMNHTGFFLLNKKQEYKCRKK